jgi:hypothetical protein
MKTKNSLLVTSLLVTWPYLSNTLIKKLNAGLNWKYLNNSSVLLLNYSKLFIIIDSSKKLVGSCYYFHQTIRIGKI